LREDYASEVEHGRGGTSDRMCWERIVEVGKFSVKVRERNS